MKNLLFALAILLFPAIQPPVWSQVNPLDPGFANDGVLIAGLLLAFDGMAIQPDGKILIGSGDWVTDFMVRRFLENGKPDTTFGDNSIAELDIGSNHHYMTALVRQVNGKILLGGFDFNPNQNPPGDGDWDLLRIDATGQPDTGFGVNGRVLTEIGGFDDRALALAVQPDGKIIQGGYSTNQDGLPRLTLVRYHPDGGLDSGFGDNGRVIADPATGARIARAVLVQPDGKILAAGSGQTGSDEDYLLARFRPDGSPDPEFGTNGVVLTAVGDSADSGSNLVLQPDGKILLSGITYTGLYPKVAFLRYQANGTPDNSFGNAGKVVTAMSGKREQNAIAVQTDGKILVTGSQNSDLCLAKYNPDGTPDLSFGVGGQAATQIDDQAIPQYIGIQPNGKVVVGGYSVVYADHFIYSHLIMARYFSHVALGLLDFEAGAAPLVYPNPIQASLSLEYELAAAATLTIALYDAGGRLAQTLLAAAPRSAGAHTEQFAVAPGLAPGSYLLRFSDGHNYFNIKVLKL